jgi:glycerol-3-phosphate cytidylyltransferase
MFHIGHLKILEKAKSNCDYLIVGVSSDELVLTEKNISLVIPFEDRAAIVNSIRYVDKVVVQDSYDKLAAWEIHQFNRMFVGNDWKGTERWLTFEKHFKQLGVEIVYLPYTRDISSSKLRDMVEANYQITKRP